MTFMQSFAVMFLVWFNQSDNEVQGFISGFSCIHDYYSNQRGTLLRVENESGPNKDQSWPLDGSEE